MVPPPGLSAPAACSDASSQDGSALRPGRVRISLDELIPRESPIDCGKGCRHASLQKSSGSASLRPSTRVPERIRVAKGLEKIKDDCDNVLGRVVPRLKDGAGCLEVFAGCGELSACLRKFGNVLPPIDIRDGPCFDMRFKKSQGVILYHIR